MSATIRPAHRTDAQRLSAFARRTFDETFSDQNTPEDMSLYLSSAFSDARQLAELDDPDTTTLVMEHETRLIAYAQLHVGDPPSCVPDQRAIELVRFYVDRTHHGRGVAQTLMEATLAAANGRAKTMWLGVWERNARAIAFYSKWRFVDVGSHTFMLGTDRQLDRIMWRQDLRSDANGGELEAHNPNQRAG
jgi:GNAT superfamily N-acetyltransferase